MAPDSITSIDMLGPVRPPTDIEAAAIRRMVASQSDANDLLGYFFGESA